MRYQHIIQAVFGSPWLITAQAHATIREIVKAHLLATEPPPNRPPAVNMCGDAVEVDQAEDRDGVAIIPVGGVIGRKLGAMERGMGAVDVADISRDLDWAEKSKDIRGIVLDFDSPGGMVNGTPELADKIAAIEKPTFAFTAGMMDSAAYWLASGADQIFATRSADVGSIGVYVPYFDESAAYAEQGVTVELFKSGKFKGMGFPGTSLTQEQRAQLQAEVDEIFEEFKAHVTKGRDIDEECMQGQSFTGKMALSLGLIDGLVGGIDDVVGLL